MRSLSSALQTAQASPERTALMRATVRDLRLNFDTTYTPTLPQSSHTVYTWDNAIMGASCKDADGAIHQVIAMNDGGYDRVYYRKVSDLGNWTGSWSGLGYFAEGRSRCAIAESGGQVRLFYSGDGSNDIFHLTKNGSWAAAVSLGWTGGTMDGTGLAAVSLTTLYAYIALNGVSGHQLYRCNYSGGTWNWTAGPRIFSSKGQGNLYAETFISAVSLGGVDYIICLDHDDGRCVLVKYQNGLFSDPASVLPMDIVSDPSDATMPSSQFRPYDISVINGQLFLTARLIRPGSDTYDFDAEVLLRGDGEHWSLDKYHCLWEYANNNYVGMKPYVVGNYVYLVAQQKVRRSLASNLVGVDLASKKTVITEDIKQGNLGHTVNSAATLAMQIANADGAYDNDPNLRPGSELVLELGWDDNQGNSDYTQYLAFGIDSVEKVEAYEEDRLSISARSICMKNLLDWRASQAYDYFSQCKIFEPFDDLGGFVEWNVGWEISDNGWIQCKKLVGTPFSVEDCPEIVVDTTDWTTLDGVLAKTRFKFSGQGPRAAGIVLNASDADYKTVVQASTPYNRITLYNMRHGVWESANTAQSGVISWALDTWYDLAVLYRAGVFRVFYKEAAASQWTEAGGGFPYTWNKPYPAIEAEIKPTDSKETQAKGAEGETYAADQGYVGLRAYAQVTTTPLAQDLWNPDRGEDEKVETVVVGTVDGWPASGILKVEDELILFSSLSSGDRETTLTDSQNPAGESYFEVADPTGFPGHGVIIVDLEAIEYSTFFNHPGHYEFKVAERGAGGTVAASHQSGATVDLESGQYTRDCRSFFNVPYITGMATGGTTQYLEDSSQPWGAQNVVGARLEVKQVPSESGGVVPAFGGVGKQQAPYGSNKWLADPDPHWTTNEWVGWELMMVSGSSVKWRTVGSNSGDTLYLTKDLPEEWCRYANGSYNLWAASSMRVLVADRGKNWTADQWNGYEVRLTKGKCIGFKSEILDTLPNETNKPNRLVLARQLPYVLQSDTEYEIWSPDVYEAQVLEIDHVEGAKIYTTEPFQKAPNETTQYTIRGRGALSTTPTAHGQGALVHWYVEAPVIFDSLEVYSLGRDFTIEYLLDDVCYRAGAEAVFDTKVSATYYPSVSANSYDGAGIDIPVRKNFEITLNITAPDDDFAAWGLVFRSTTDGPWSGTLPIAGESAYEIKIRDNAGNPYIQLSDNMGGETVLERASIGFEVSGTHVWRISAWEDFFSVWCDDRFVWAFHNPAHQGAGYMAVRAYNHDSGGGAINYSLAFAIPGLCERMPWYGYISGMTAQQAVQDLIRQRHIWYVEKPDKTLKFSRFDTRENLGTYSDLHEQSRSQDDRSIASVVLVTSEEYAFYVHPATLVEHGYRFLEVNNPDLNTEEECLDEAKAIQRMSREQSDVRGFFTERARLEAEPEDKFTFGAADCVVNDVSLNMGLAMLSQNFGSRKYES